MPFLLFFRGSSQGVFSEKCVFFACAFLVDLRGERVNFKYDFSHFLPSTAGLLTRYRRAARARPSTMRISNKKIKIEKK